jgi:hypothetical protein
VRKVNLGAHGRARRVCRCVQTGHRIASGIPAFRDVDEPLLTGIT